MKIPHFSLKTFVKFAIGIIISGIFIYLTLSKVNFSETLNSLKQMNYWFILPAIILHMITFLVRAIKWKTLLDNLKKLPLFKVYRVTTIGFMFNNVLPFRIGEIARSHILGKDESISRTSVLGTIFIEKISDAISLLLIIFTLGFGFVRQGSSFQNIGTVIIIFAVLAVFAGLGIFFEDQIIRLLEIITKRFSRIALLTHVMKSFLNGLKTINSKTTFVKVGVLSLLVWIMEALPYYMISLGFGFDLNFLQILLVCSVVNIGLLIPSSPGYIGTFHFFCVLALTAFGISSNIALSYAIITHITLWIPITIVGYIFFGSTSVLRPKDYAGLRTTYVDK